MKKTIFYSTLLILAIVSCKDKENPQTTPPDPTAALLIGKWDTKTYQGKLYLNNNLEIDTTIPPPYNGMIDMVEYIRFTNQLMYLKIGNESDETDPIQYFKKGNYLMITDGIETDTALLIDKLTDKEFNFTFSERYIDDDDNEIRRYESYTSLK